MGACGGVLGRGWGCLILRPVSEPAPTVRTHDSCGLLTARRVMDECGFRILEPGRVAVLRAAPPLCPASVLCAPGWGALGVLPLAARGQDNGQVLTLRTRRD
jgi:hypothetical protein